MISRLLKELTTSTFFELVARHRAPVSGDARITATLEQGGRYLTDGVNLYRFLGCLASRAGRGRLAGLENCRSLDIVLVPIEELRRLRLWTVTTAEQPCHR